MLLGIDEVGRGALAGPLVVSCVALERNVSGLKDSKKLTNLKRNQLYYDIFLSSKFVSLGWVWPHEIDLYGLTKATQIAILRAINNLNIKDNFSIIIDGNYNYLEGLNYDVKTIIKADDKIKEVSAASIVAKVSRDNYMKKIDRCFPLYNFKTNVGYGTKEHISAIKSQGPSQIHRSLFLKKIT